MSRSTKSPVRVVALTIRNILGVTDAEIKPGQVTIIEGANGTGKTSRIEAFKSVLTGGHSATLLHKGAENGEIVMVLSDGVEIRKRINGAKSDTSVTHPEFGKLSKPATYLDSLRDAFAINPIDFLTAKPEKRVELLLSAIPMVVAPVDLAGIVEYCKAQPDLSRHALQVLTGIEKDLEDQRRDINRTAKEKRATVEEMTKALPAETGDVALAQLASVELEYSDFRDENDKARNAIITKAMQDVNTLKDELRLRIADGDRAYNEELAKLKAKYDAGAEALRAMNRDECADIDRIANKELAGLANDRTDKTVTFESALATARANADSFTRSKAARDLIAKMETGAAALEADSESLSTALTELDNVRGNLLESLPIKGVTLSDGDVFVDGIPFDRVNESRRVRLAFEIAGLRSGNLPFMVIDGAERLDAASLQTVADVAVENNLQLVLSKVTDGPLEVSRIA